MSAKIWIACPRMCLSMTTHVLVLQPAMLVQAVSDLLVIGHVEVRDSPARDIWFLHAVHQGSYQMGRVVGTSPSSSPSVGFTGGLSTPGPPTLRTLLD